WGPLLVSRDDQPMNGDYLNSAVAVSSLGFLVCFYAAKYELSVLDVSTGQGWWPPNQWVVQIWRAIQMVDGQKSRLIFWGVMMWIFAVTTILLVPFLFYLVYRSFA